MVSWLSAGLLGAVVAVALAMLVQRLLDQRDAGRLPPPGRLVNVGRHRMHLLEMGTGSPSVVFDSAIGSTCLSWERVQPEVARFARAVSYDRAGFGWSEPGTSKGDVSENVELLRRLLETAGVPPPYVLVGHSYGGFTMRLFAQRHRELVAGVVLIDAADTQQWIRLERSDRRKVNQGALLARRGVWLSYLGIPRFVTWLGSTGAVKLAKRAASLLTKGMPQPTQDRLLTPLDHLSWRTRQAIKWFWTRPSFYRSLARQIETVPSSAMEVEHSGPLSDLPLVVMAAPNQEARWLPVQRQLAQLSSRSRFLLVENSSHWIPLDRPDAVIDAIAWICDQYQGQKTAAH